MISPYVGRTINTQEIVPEELYIFVQMNDPMCANNYAVGGWASGALSSACMSNENLKRYLTGDIDYFVDPEGLALSPFYVRGKCHNQMETKCNEIRRNINRLLPSRASAVYAFGDAQSCEFVADKFNWDISEVKKFKLNINPLTRVAKVNMQIISHLLGMVEFPENIDEIFQDYWSGKSSSIIKLNNATHEVNEVVWEYLIDGKVETIS